MVKELKGLKVVGKAGVPRATHALHRIKTYELSGLGSTVVSTLILGLRKTLRFLERKTAVRAHHHDHYPENEAKSKYGTTA